MGGRSERTQGQPKMAAWNSFSYICTRALHAFRYLGHCRAASTVIPLLPTATFTRSIQPNLCLPRTRPSLTSAINTFLAIRYSSTFFIKYCNIMFFMIVFWFVCDRPLGHLFSCPLCFFPWSRLSSYLLRLFLYLISFLLFLCSSIWENTRAWVPHFL